MLTDEMRPWWKKLFCWNMELGVNFLQDNCRAFFWKPCSSVVSKGAHKGKRYNTICNHINIKHVYNFEATEQIVGCTVYRKDAPHPESASRAAQISSYYLLANLEGIIIE